MDPRWFFGFPPQEQIKRKGDTIYSLWQVCLVWTNDLRCVLTTHGTRTVSISSTRLTKTTMVQNNNNNNNYKQQQQTSLTMLTSTRRMAAGQALRALVVLVSAEFLSRWPSSAMRSPRPSVALITLP